MARIGGCYNIADFQWQARKRLPTPLYHYIEGGADDELTRAANTAAFDRYALVPDYLHDIRSIDMRRTVLGRELAWPLMLAPTGMTRLFHKDGERGVAVEAARSGVGYTLSTMATASIEDIAAHCSGPKIFQLYLLNDDALNFETIDRCKAAGFDAICLTVDTVVAGNRERDLRTGLTIPPKISLAGLAKFAMRPRWCVDYLLGEKFSLPNVGRGGAGTYRHWLRILQSGWSVISVGPRLNGASLIGVGRSRSKDFSPSMMRDWPQRQAQVRWSCPTMGGGNSMAFHRPSIWWPTWSMRLEIGWR